MSNYIDNKRLNKKINSYATFPSVFDTEDDNIYVGLTIFNESNQKKQASIQKAFTEYIVDRASDYYVSLIEFSMPESSVKILTFRENKWSVTLESQGNYYRSFLTFFDQLNNENYIYSYQHFLDIINNSFSEAFTALKAAHPGAPPTEAPQMLFNAAK